MRAESSLQDFPGLKSREWEAFEKAGFHTGQELLDWLPKRYEDRRRFDAFPAQAGGSAVCLRGVVLDTQRKGFGGKGFYEAVIEDEPGGGFSRLTCRWFNMPYMSKVIAAGQEVVLYGKPKENNGRIVIDHPEFEVMKEDAELSLHLERLVPIYRNVNGIPQRRLREIIHGVLELV
ncbi:MAG: DNA helicase RecG, partial [Akkermansiaceae bacterium]|nr:DNA helicase RecG [Akkermansiaceae bacterium]